MGFYSTYSKPALALMIGFIVGLVCALSLPLVYKKVVLYPTPGNAATLVYQDKAGVCFKPSVTEVKCSSQSKAIPVQS